MAGRVWAALARLFERLGPRLTQLLQVDPDRDLERLRRWVVERLDHPMPRIALARAAGCSEAENVRLKKMYKWRRQSHPLPSRPQARGAVVGLRR